MSVSSVLSSYIIGTLIESGSTIKTSRANIEAWPDYGVVCYPLGTLNGSIPAIAAGLVELIKGQERMQKELSDPDYRVEVFLDGQEEACLSVDEVTDRLSELYQGAVKTD